CRRQLHALVKKKHVIIVGAFAVLGIAYVSGIIPNVRQRSEWNKTVTALRALPRDRAASAVQAFVRDQKAKGRSVSDTVSLRELVAAGFLPADDAAPFTGMDVTFAVGVDETHPQQIAVRVPLHTGGVVVQLADGSICQVTRSALERQDHK